MKRIYGILAAAMMVPAMFSCSPDYSDFTPETSAEPVTSVTAAIDLDGDGIDEEFSGQPDENGRIEIVFPYFYPEESDNQVTEEDLASVKVTGVLANNVTVEPVLLKMDLNTENHIVATDQIKATKEYVITGRIAKLTGCDITSFSLPDVNLEGIIAGKNISLVTMENFENEMTANLTLSPHATISPDPRETAIDWNNEVKLTVTAHDGVTKKEYTVVKNIPSKLPSGIRPESVTELFKKRLNADLGITGSDNTTGIAISGDYLIVNTRNQNAKVINRMTGEYVGEMSGMSAILGSLKNYYMTSDDDGNILVNSLATAAGKVQMWKFSGKDDILTAQPVEYINWSAPAGYGRKVSIIGSLDSDAIITATCGTGLPTGNFAKWTVTDGVLQSQEPEIVTAGTTWDNYQADIMYASTEPGADYFLINYKANVLSWLSGVDNTLKAQIPAIQSSTNYFANELDIFEYNNATFLAAQQTNNMNGGTGDAVWLLDITNENNFSGSLYDGSQGAPACPAVQWWCQNEYCAIALAKAEGTTPVINGNAVGEILLTSSEDGYYLQLYIMFCNGYVAGVQFDCLDI